uniref:DUF4352 domain-containing protein n=1 Tax=Streptomyces sp. NBC_01393 TaxID=2903851 RepID=A0AAU3HNK4_9ACTN
MTHPKKALLSAILLAVLGASMAACSGDGHESKGDAVDKAKTSRAEEQQAWAEDQQEWADKQQASTFVVGLTDTAKWKSGVTAKLDGFARRRITEDDVSMLDEGQPYLSFKITVTNGSKEPLGMDGFNMVCPAGSTEVQMGAINGVPDNHLLVGDSVTWTAACTFEPTETKLQVELTPPTNRETWDVAGTAIFNGTVATR